MTVIVKFPLDHWGGTGLMLVEPLLHRSSGSTNIIDTISRLAPEMEQVIPGCDRRKSLGLVDEHPRSPTIITPTLETTRKDLLHLGFHSRECVTRFWMIPGLAQNHHADMVMSTTAFGGCGQSTTASAGVDRTTLQALPTLRDVTNKFEYGLWSMLRGSCWYRIQCSPEYWSN